MVSAVFHSPLAAASESIAPKTEAIKQEPTGAMATKSVKCERCWHYQDDVGSDATHPTLCGRCTSNLFGAGETRVFA